jgi:hypothetical protein
MDVINFSGGPQIDPANDALIEAVHNTAAAASHRDRSRERPRRPGSVPLPSTAPDAIPVAATSNTHVFAPSLDVTAPGPPAHRGHPVHPQTARAHLRRGHQQLVDVGSSRHGRKPVGASVAVGRTRQPQGRCRPVARRDRTVQRGIARWPKRPSRRGSRARSGSSSRTTGRARRVGCPSASRSPAVRSRTSTETGCGRTWPRTAGERRCESAAARSSSRPDEAA